METSFEWDEQKNIENQAKHKISFEEAQEAFRDARRIIYEDLDHSTPEETRYKCIGKIDKRGCTIRFTYREEKIGIFGAGFWQKEKKLYEREN